MKRRAGAILMAAALLLGAGGGQAAEKAPQKLRRAHGFALPDWQGKTFRLSDYRGQVVLLQFFRTGCALCQEEAPLLEQLYRDYRNKGVVVIGISHEAKAAEALAQYGERYGITHPLLLGDLEVAVRYLGLSPARPSFHTPHFFLIDREGYIVREFAPERDEEFFRQAERALPQALKEVLAGSPSSGPGRTASPKP